MIRKLLIVPFFGDLPPWFPHWEANVESHLLPDGYDVLMDTDEEDFRGRVKERLGVVCPPMAGTGKIWDFRPAFGVLYADEIRGYDFWGHTDLDCVYGRVGEFVTDGVLEGLDQFSNHGEYVCGCWSLYRNTTEVNWLFEGVEDWRELMANARPSGWIEASFSDLVARELRCRWETWQTASFDSFDRVRWDGDRLVEGGRKIMMAHFRRLKVYPEQLKR